MQSPRHNLRQDVVHSEDEIFGSIKIDLGMCSLILILITARCRCVVIKFQAISEEITGQTKIPHLI